MTSINASTERQLLDRSDESLHRIMGKIYDISLPLSDSILTYPGNPTTRITLQQAVAEGGSANVSAISFGSHTGTHVDAPRHFFDTGTSVDQLPLELFMGPAAVVAFPTSVMAIQPQDLIEQGIEEIDAEYRKRILLKTRNSELLTQDPTFHRDYTYLTPEGADYLVKYGVQLVGIDYLSIEQFRSGHHRTHRTLLEHNVVIVEGLKLDGVPPGVYELRCLPLRIKGCDGAPARAVLLEVS